MIRVPKRSKTFECTGQACGRPRTALAPFPVRGSARISPQGKITRYFVGLAFLPFDVKLGLLEASEGKIGPTISKILLYCFRYDPEGKRYVFDILKVTGTVTLFFLAIFVTWLVISTRIKKKREKSAEEKKKENKS